ncbi:Programmed cell death protein 6 [Borealophlyctis nickersoniae]|nr:Programmed cell death protein 6 [Borealophlyctis nickersoniae]
MSIERNKVEERAGNMLTFESQLQQEQREKQLLQARVAAIPQLEQRLQLEQEEKARLQQRLATFPATVAELEHKLQLEQIEKKRLETSLAGMASMESLAKSDREAKAEAERKLAEVTSDLQASRLALSDLGRTKAELENIIKSKDLEIAHVTERLNNYIRDEASGHARIQAEKGKLEQELAAKQMDIDKLSEQLMADTAALNGRLYEAEMAKAAMATQLREIQARYEPPPQDVGGPEVYNKPPPSQPLPMPKGVDPELWAWFQAVDPYQLKSINSAQLHDALLNGPWPPLSLSTCRSLHALFDRSGVSFKYEDFVKLFDLVCEWKSVFHAFDGHETETQFRYVERKDLKAALNKAGVRVSEKFLGVFLTKLRRQTQPIGWDDFVQYAARVKLVADAFKEHDRDNDSWATISYDQFMVLVVNASL